MNPTRARIGYALILLACCMASYVATPATSETITTPPPGSRERGAIFDALRAELTHLTGPDLVFVVAVLRVREGWAWIEAARQSRDGARRDEDVTALLQRRDGRWVVQVLGPCDEDDPAACVADTDPERLLERFPTLPPGLVAARGRVRRERGARGCVRHDDGRLPAAASRALLAGLGRGVRRARPDPSARVVSRVEHALGRPAHPGYGDPGERADPARPDLS